MEVLDLLWASLDGTALLHAMRGEPCPLLRSQGCENQTAQGAKGPPLIVRGGQFRQFRPEDPTCLMNRTQITHVRGKIRQAGLW